MFGWKGDVLQRILDTDCYFDEPACKASGARVQSVEEMNGCVLGRVVEEDIDGCKFDVLLVI